MQKVRLIPALAEDRPWEIRYIEHDGAPHAHIDDVLGLLRTEAAKPPRDGKLADIIVALQDAAEDAYA